MSKSIFQLMSDAAQKIQFISKCLTTLSNKENSKEIIDSFKRSSDFLLRSAETRIIDYRKLLSVTKEIRKDAEKIFFTPALIDGVENHLMYKVLILEVKTLYSIVNDALNP